MFKSMKLINWLIWVAMLALILVSLFKFSANLRLTHITFYSYELRVDYLFHFAVFFFLALFQPYASSLLIFIKTSILLLCLGVLSELIQVILPYREFSIVDLFSNFLGVFIGSTVILPNILKKNRANF